MTDNYKISEMNNSSACILYFLGQLGLMFQLRFFFQWILEFYKHSNAETSLFLTPGIVGVFLLVFRVADAILDPMVGGYSDMLLGKGERRTKLMKIGLPLISFGLVLSFYRMDNSTQVGQYLLLLVSLFTFFVGYTLYCIPFWALIEDLSVSNKDLAGSLSSALGLGIFIASAISFVCTPILISQYGYFHSAIAVCILSMILMSLPLRLDKVITNTHTHVGASQMTFKRFMIPLKDKSFMKVIMLLGAIQASFTILTAISASFVELVIDKDKTFTSYLMAPVIIVGIFTFLFLGKLLRTYDSMNLAKMFVFLQGLFFTMCLPLYFLVDKSHYLNSYALLFGLFGVPVAIILGIEALLVKKITPDSSYAGLYFGSFNFLIKTINGFAIMITGFILSYTDKSNAHYIPIFLTICGICITAVVLLTHKKVES